MLSKIDHYLKGEQEKKREKEEGKRVVASALWKIIYYSKDRTSSWEKKNNHEKWTQFIFEWTTLLPVSQVPDATILPFSPSSLTLNAAPD